VIRSAAPVDPDRGAQFARAPRRVRAGPHGTAGALEYHAHSGSASLRWEPGLAWNQASKAEA
jgi:hypothetical protein